MGEEERNLAGLLRRSVPEPEVEIAFDDLARAVRRRRRFGVLVPVGAAVAVLAVSAVAAVLGGRQEPGPGPTAKGPVVSAASSATPTESPLRTGCPATEEYPDGRVVMVDYVPFLQLGGRQFVSEMWGKHTSGRADLGEQVASVTCTISKLTEDGDKRVIGGFRDGNSAYLPVGTAIFSVTGYRSDCRVAVIEEGKVRAYLAEHEVNHKSTPRPCALHPEE